MRTFNHIRDCWSAIQACKTIDEVNEVLDDIPRGFGEWWVDVVYPDGIPCYEVTNHYYDGQLDDYFTDSEELDIPVAEEDL
jgi:hypothetical protein